MNDDAFPLSSSLCVVSRYATYTIVKIIAVAGTTKNSASWKNMRILADWKNMKATRCNVCNVSRGWKRSSSLLMIVSKWRVLWWNWLYLGCWFRWCCQRTALFFVCLFGSCFAPVPFSFFLWCAGSSRTNHSQSIRVSDRRSQTRVALKVFLPAASATIHYLIIRTKVFQRKVLRLQ